MNTVLESLGTTIGFLLAIGLLIVIVIMVWVLIDLARIAFLTLKIKILTKKVEMATKRQGVTQHEEE
jgi:uncharacterized membrane protein (DUF485 family)